jgi:hypothetical protein
MKSSLKRGYLTIDTAAIAAQMKKSTTFGETQIICNEVEVVSDVYYEAGRETLPLIQNKTTGLID